MTWDKSAAASDRRKELLSYAREQCDLAHLQLDERYDPGRVEGYEQICVLSSIAHSLAAIASLMLADKEVTQ